MEYKLYTLVDITRTGQYRNEPGKQKERWQQQNFNTIIQTLGIRSNISYNIPPQVMEVKGSLVGFDTDQILRVWRFDFYSERDYVYEKDSDPVGFLKEDFMLVPYINGLNESMDQQYSVFNTEDPGPNITFFQK